MLVEYHIRESPSVSAGDGSHMLVPVLSRLIDPRLISRSQLPGKIAHQRLIGSSVYMDLFLGKGNGKIGGMRGQLAARRFGGGGNFLLGGSDYLARVLFSDGLDAGFLRGAF